MEKKVKESQNYCIVARDIPNEFREALKKEAEERQAAYLTAAERRLKEIQAAYAELDAQVEAAEKEKEAAEKEN